MFLRHHPLMSYHGVPSWPPTWVWIGGEEKRTRGEVGILKKVIPSKLKTANRVYVYVDHEGSSYIGCLLFDDPVFCRHITQVLESCLNRSIAEIGGLDLTYTL